MSDTRAAVVEKAGAGPRVLPLLVSDPEPDEVVIEVRAAGICHTDLSVAAGLLLDAYPVVLGHEIAGVVRCCGSAVREFAPGDRVIVAIDRQCGRCRYCEGGNPVLCSAGGLERRWRRVRAGDGTPVLQSCGGFGGLTTATVDQLVRLPDDVPFDVGAIACCAVATGLGAATNVAPIAAGSTVVVVGAGGVGLSAILGARLRGAAAVVAVDTNEQRCGVAGEFGATTALPPDDAAIRAATGGGADVVIECAGRPGTVELALTVARPGGTVVVLGAPPESSSYSVRTLQFVIEQKRIVGCRQGALRPHIDIPAWFELRRRGVLPLDRLVTNRIPLDEIAEGFQRVGAGEGIKTVVVSDG